MNTYLFKFHILPYIGLISILNNILSAQEKTTDNVDMKIIKKAIEAARQAPTIENFLAANEKLDVFEPKDRDENAQYFLYTAQLLSIVSVNLEAKRRQNVPKPSLNVMPPLDPKTGFGSSGMSPDGIKDLKLRKKYKNDIAENSRNAKFWLEVNQLENLENRWAAILGYQAATRFGKDNKAVTAFKKELADQGVPEKTILKAVTKMNERR